MQLSRIVHFHKALADPTRIRMMALLSKGPMHGQALAGLLGLTPPTITHHIAKLREAGLLKERRDKNTIYFYLDEKNLMLDTQASLQVIMQGGLMESGLAMDNQQEAVSTQQQDRYQIIKNFFTPDGRLKQIPAQRKKKLLVFEHLIQGFEMGRKYTEKEINEYILRFHHDYATIRREFIMNHYMYRENGIYEMNPPEMWEKPGK